MDLRLALVVTLAVMTVVHCVDKPPTNGGGGGGGGDKPPTDGSDKPPTNGGDKPPTNGGDKPPTDGAEGGETKSIPTAEEIKESLIDAMRKMMKHEKRRNVCPTGQIFCAERNMCVPVNCESLPKLTDNIHDKLRESLNHQMRKSLKKKDRKIRSVCGYGKIFCAERNMCVPVNCESLPKLTDNIRDKLRDRLNQQMRKSLKKKDRKIRSVCGYGKIFCAERNMCVPVNCGSLPKLTDNIRDKLREKLYSQMRRTLEKKDRKRHSVCGYGKIFCVERQKCVPVRCSSLENSKGEDIRQKLRDNLRRLVKESLRKKERKMGGVCGHGRYYCIERHACIPVRCPKQKSTGDYLRDSLMNEIRDKMGDSKNGYEVVNKPCGTGSIYCVQSGRCVSATCAARNVEKPGECPLPADVISTNDKKCEMQNCMSDNEGCNGNLKCCPSACGGTYCAMPEVNFGNTDGEEPPPQRCRVATYMADQADKPIAMSSGKPTAMFYQVKDVPSTLQFNITSATKGCTWKKVVGEKEVIIVKPEEEEAGNKDVAETDKANGGQNKEETETVLTWEAIKHNDIISIDDRISCIPDDITFHGVVKVNVTDQKKEVHTLVVLVIPAKIPPVISLNDGATNVIDLKEDYPEEFEIPVTVSDLTNLDTQELTTEDLYCISATEYSKAAYQGYVKRIEQLKEKQTSTASLGVFVSVVTKLKERVGELSLRRLESSDAASEKSSTNGKTRDDEWQLIQQKNGGVAGDKFVKFKPELDYHGEFEVLVRAWSGAFPYGAKDLSTEGIKFTVKIASVNDAPRLKDRDLALMEADSRALWTVMEIPLESAGEGVLVSEAASLYFVDPETTNLGICVIRAENSDIGSYQYLMPGSDSWVKIELDSPEPTGDGKFGTFHPGNIAKECGYSSFWKLRSDSDSDDSFKPSDICSDLYNHECLLLPPDARIRFKPSAADNFWAYTANTYWDFFAWDIEADDTNEAGKKVSVTLPLCEDCMKVGSVLSVEYLSGNAMRLSCHGRQSENRIVDDVCGVCGGDGSSCVDCAGVKDGGAKVNLCGECVLGNTGKEESHGVNCIGECDNSYKIFTENNLDGACLPSDTDVVKMIKEVYCDGEWGSGAKYDSCGVCSGGSTDKKRNQDMDVCQVCFGDGSSCVDCKGDANGNRVVDECGECRLPTDPEFNKGCQSFDVKSELGFVSTAGTLIIGGAGLEKLRDPTCSLVLESNSVELTVVKFQARQSYIEAEYPAVDTAGRYTVKCTFKDKSGNDVSREASNEFELYSLPKLTGVTPSTAELGKIPSEITMAGSGFVNTGIAYCYSDCPVRISPDCKKKDSIVVFEAKLSEDGGSVVCIIPENINADLKVGFVAQFSVSFSMPDASSRFAISPVSFSVIPPAPTAEGAVFVGACRVKVTFSQTINEIDDCSAAFATATVEKLGDEPECSVRGNTLVIRLGTDSTLKAGDSINLKANTIAQRGSETASGALYAATGDITVTSSAEDVARFERFDTVSAIGNCDSYTIKAKFQGARCSSLEYKWRVELEEESADADVNTNLATIQTKLDGITTGEVPLTNEDMVAGHSYIFTVFVTSHLGVNSDEKSTTITRKAEEQALIINLGGDRLDHDPQTSLTLKPYLTKSDCNTYEFTQLQFIWSEESSKIDLSSFTRPKVKLRKGALRGGEEYKISLTALLSTNTDVYAKETITITTASTPIEAKIRGAPEFDTGADRKLVLDGSRTFDPDKTEYDDVYFVWQCEKLAEDADGNEQALPCMLTITDAGGQEEEIQFEKYSEVAARGPLVVIPAHALQTSTVYRIKLDYRRNEMSASTSIDVTVKEGSPPAITIVPLEQSHHPGKPLAIRAFISSPLEFTASWSSVEGEGFEVVPISEIDNSDKIFSRGNRVPTPLVIQPESFKVGARYKFLLYVKHDDQSAEATTEVVINSPPDCKPLQVSPTEGEALTDDFTVTVEGCEDDDFPLLYRFFVIDNEDGTETGFPAGLQEDSSFVTKLSEGSRTFGVYVCDNLRVCTRLEAVSPVTVTTVELTDDTITNLLDQIESEDALDGESSLGDQLLQAIIGKEDATDELKQVAVELAENSAKKALSYASPKDDPEGSMDKVSQTVDTISKTKSSIQNATVSEGVKDQIKEKAKDTATYSVKPDAPEEEAAAEETAAEGTTTEEAAGGQESVRRKRAADGLESSILSMEIESGKTLMEALLLSLDGTEEGDITKEDAVDFFLTLETVWQGVCAGQFNGQDADMEEIATLAFRAVTTTFDDLANTTLYASCKNCTYLANEALVQLGQYLEEEYSQWNCTDSEVCYGACLATGQLSYDVLTASSDAIEPLISDRYSDIVAVHLINPITYEYVEVTNMPNPITIILPLTSDPSYDTHQYMCRHWDYSTNDWTDDSCLAAVLDNSTDTWIATCECYATGYYGVFEGAELVSAVLQTTTEFEIVAGNGTTPSTNNNSSTVRVGETSTPLTNKSTTTNVAIVKETTTATDYLDDASDVNSVTVTFKIDADSNLLVTNYSAVKEDILDWLVDTMSVERDRIENLFLTAGSIVVEFDLVAKGSGDLNVLLTKLEKQVSAGAKITILGKDYDCIADSFGVKVNRAATVVAEAPPSMKMGLIIGIVVGCSLLIILVVVIVAVVIIKKKGGSNKVKHSPRTSQTHLRQAELGTYEFRQTKATPAEEALYGPAPVPHRPGSVSKGVDVPIGSRPTSRNEKGCLTPVS